MKAGSGLKPRCVLMASMGTLVLALLVQTVRAPCWRASSSPASFRGERQAAPAVMAGRSGQAGVQAGRVGQVTPQFREGRHLARVGDHQFDAVR